MEAALHAGSLLAAGLRQPLSENSRPGHQLSTVALYLGIGFINTNTATGLRVCLYDDGRRSRDTGKERDSESGLDYFGARYYGNAPGRFTSPDHPLIDQHPENPQSWNLYAYARNNPLINIDPTGLGCVTDLGQGSDANHESVELNNSINSVDCAGQHGTWVPGDVNNDNIGAFRGDDGNINFQVTTNTGGNVYYSSFVSGAQTDANGVGQGASIAHASADWLSSQIVGGGSLEQMMSFAAKSHCWFIWHGQTEDDQLCRPNRL